MAFVGEIVPSKIMMEAKNLLSGTKFSVSGLIPYTSPPELNFASTKSDVIQVTAASKFKVYLISDFVSVAQGEREMRRMLRLTWLRICNLMKVPKAPKKSLRDKSMAMAETISVIEDGDFLKVFCPVCSDVIRTTPDSDVRLILAVHLSLWHPDDVEAHWETMLNTGDSIQGVSRFVLGIGITAGFAALLALLAKKHARSLVAKKEIPPALELRWRT